MSTTPLLGLTRPSGAPRGARSARPAPPSSHLLPLLDDACPAPSAQGTELDTPLGTLGGLWLKLRDFPRLYGVYREHRRRLAGMESYSIRQEGLDYLCPLNDAKRRNLALQQINKEVLPWVELALPHIVHVGVTTHCNIRCPGCPTGNDTLWRKREHLDYGVYARMVDELRGALLFLLFWDWGEPFLHPRLPDMLAHAKRSGIKTVVSTNGTVNNSPDKIERLLDGEPDVVMVCVDGIDQATHEKYRVGARLTTVLDTIRRLRAAKDRRGLTAPVIEFRTLATRYNEAQLPQLLELARGLGADSFVVKSLRPHDYSGTNIAEELAPQSAKWARQGDMGRSFGAAAGAPQRAHEGPLACGKPLYSPSLNSDGRIAGCSYVREPEEIFGVFAAQGFRRMWRSAASRRKRLHFLAREGTRSCDSCFFRTVQPPCVAHVVPLQPFPPDVRPAAAETPEQFLEFWRRTQEAPPRVRAAA